MEKLTYLEPCANLDYFSDMKNKKKMGNNDYRGVTSSFWDAVLRFSV